jgi:hypothetical protein
MLPVSHWWELRKQFKRSIPGVVTDNYLATVLEMKIDSARNNVLPYLKQFKIIDDEGKTAERAKQWRDDERYTKVCQEMLVETYPKDLLDAAPSADDRGKAERWFANHTGAGESAAGRMAAIYAVLLQGDVTKQPEQEKKERPQRQAREEHAAAMRSFPRAVAVPAVAKPSPAVPQGGDKHIDRPAVPDININLQVHISADATPDQIDQIFASMSKHIYRRD